MAIYFEIDPATNLIVNAIEYDGKADYTPPDGLELLKRDPNCEAWIGWTYDGTDFLPPQEETSTPSQ